MPPGGQCRQRAAWPSRSQLSHQGPGDQESLPQGEVSHRDQTAALLPARANWTGAGRPRPGLQDTDPSGGQMITAPFCLGEGCRGAGSCYRANIHSLTRCHTRFSGKEGTISGEALRHKPSSFGEMQPHRSVTAFWLQQAPSTTSKHLHLQRGSFQTWSFPERPPHHHLSLPPSGPAPQTRPDHQLLLIGPCLARPMTEDWQGPAGTTQDPVCVRAVPARHGPPRAPQPLGRGPAPWELGATTGGRAGTPGRTSWGSSPACGRSPSTPSLTASGPNSSWVSWESGHGRVGVGKGWMS